MTHRAIDRDQFALDHANADGNTGVDLGELQRQHGTGGRGFAADNQKLVFVNTLHNDVAQHAQLATRRPPNSEPRMTSSPKHKHLNASVVAKQSRTANTRWQRRCR